MANQVYSKCKNSKYGIIRRERDWINHINTFSHLWGHLHLQSMSMLRSNIINFQKVIST